MNVIRQFYAGIIPICIMLLALCVGLILMQRQLQVNNINIQETVTPTPTPLPGAHIRITGIVGCLPHKDQTGAQSLECAMGLKDENETYYGIRDTDQENMHIRDIPGNTKVRIEGMFYPQDDERYPTVGILEIYSLQRL